MLSKIRQHREALRKLLPSIEKQRNELEWCQKMFDKHSSSDSEFIFIPIESDAEAVNIILLNFEEFGKTAHDNGFQLTAKYECDGHKIYVAGVQNEANLKETTKSFDELVGRQRQKSMDDDNIVMRNKDLQEKVDEYEMKIKEQQEEIEDYARKTEVFEKRIVEQTKKMEDNEEKFKKREEEMEKQIRQHVFNPISWFKPDFHLFLEDKNLKMIKNSAVILDGLGNRLFEREKEDSDEPPLKEFHSRERRRKEVFDFIEVITLRRTNWSTLDSETNILTHIHYWFFNNNHQFGYNPSEKEKDVSRKMFSNAFKLENTIGTIHFLPIYFRDRSEYFCFAIFNYRIVRWKWGYSQQEAYSDLYNNLKDLPQWTENTKFATEMEVNDRQCDRLIHTSNKDVFVENEKVVTWIKNNFDSERQHNLYRCYATIIPSLYNFFVKFYYPYSI